MPPSIDGAGRLRRIRHITLPGILPTFTILFVIQLGYLLNAGFEQQLLLGNDLVRDVSKVLDIFVRRYGLVLGRYSFSVAAGIFKSLASVILIVSANAIARRLELESLF